MQLLVCQQLEVVVVGVCLTKRRLDIRVGLTKLSSTYGCLVGGNRANRGGVAVRVRV